MYLDRIQLFHILLGSFNNHSCLSLIDVYLWIRSPDEYVIFYTGRTFIICNDELKTTFLLLFSVIALQIHGYRHRNIFLMQYVPYSLLVLGLITILGGLAWFAVTMINMNAGFLTRETFLLERLRFKGNAFKELRYREEAFRLVTSGRVPPRVFILTAFVNQYVFQSEKANRNQSFTLI